MKTGTIRFWGKVWSETVGISAALTVMLYVLTGMDIGFRGQGNLFENVVSLLAWYLIIGSTFTAFVMIVAVFQQYIPLTVSLGSTRKRAVLGALVLGPASSAAALAAAALMWKIAGDEISRSGLHLTGALAAGILVIHAIAVLFGTLILRFRRVTVILMTMGLLVGAGAGITWYLTTSGKLADRIVWMAKVLAETGEPLIGAGLTGAGAAVYLLMSGLCLGLTRRIEVRM